MNLTAAGKRAAGWLKAQDRTHLLVAAGLLLILLILLSECAPTDSSEKTQQPQELTTAQYAEQLEQRLETLIAEVDGAGRTRVMVTLRSGVEYVYASEDRSSVDTTQSSGSGGQQSSGSREDSESSYIIVEDKDGKHALVRTELEPTVSGVVVLCEGAGSDEVRERVENVVTTALNISSRRVCITLLTSQEEQQ